MKSKHVAEQYAVARSCLFWGLMLMVPSLVLAYWLEPNNPLRWFIVYPAGVFIGVGLGMLYWTKIQWPTGDYDPHYWNRHLQEWMRR